MDREAIDAILGHPVLSERLFFPRRHAVADGLEVRVPGAELSCVLHAPRSGSLTVVYFHGNGETVTDGRVMLLPALDRLGLNVMLAEYRGYAASTGSPTLPTLVDDACEIVRSVIGTLGIGAEQILLFGRSLGSLAAIQAASSFPDAAGLILESGVADPLERVLLRVRPEELGCDMDGLCRAVAARLDHRGALERFRQPVMVMHARNDTLVSVDHGLRLHRWAGAGARLEIFDRGDHNTLLWENEQTYLELVRSFVSDLRGG